MSQAFEARVSAIMKVIGLLSKLTARIFHPLVICQRSLWCSQKHAFTFRAGSGSSHPARALKSNSRRLMRRQIPPRRRVARFGNHVDVRQVGLLHFPARFRLVFTVCFVSLLCAHPRGTWSAIFTARRRRFFFFFFFLRFLFLFLFGRSLASRRRHETRYSRNFWHFSRRGTTLSQYSPVLCPFFLPSFLSSLLPSVVSTPLQRVSRHDFCRRRADFFRRTLLSSLSSRPVTLNGINLLRRLQENSQS